MFRLMAFSVLGLVVAAATPIVLFTAPDFVKAVRQQWTSTSAVAPAETPGQASGLNTAAPGATNSVTAWEGEPVDDLAEVLRFDVTPHWIMRRWPRVSTGLAELPLQGYRVPLVTGTAESDVAGSLTYYFNAQQQVQRITFHGTSGDVRELVGAMTSRYRFARKLTNDPGMFVYEAPSSSGKPSGWLKITTAGVFKASEPHRRFRVDLSMERPS